MQSNRLPQVIRQVDWQSLFPWLILFRALRLAASPVPMLLGFIAVSLTAIVASTVGFLLLSPAEATFVEHAEAPLVVTRYFGGTLFGPLQQLEAEYTRPFRYLFLHSPKDVCTWKENVRWGVPKVLISLTSLVLAAILGGAICRRALSQLAGFEAPSLEDLGRFIKERWLALILSPLYPLLGLALMALVCFPLSWLMGSSVGQWIVAVLSPLILLVAIAGAVLILGIYLGWPLFLPSIAAERDADAFDAFGRTYSYVLGRPLRVLFYLGILTLGSLLGTMLISALVHVIWETFLGLIYGEGPAIFRLTEDGLSRSEKVTLLLKENGLFRLLHHVLFLLPATYAYAYFWCAASAMYLLLRQDVDGKAMDEIARLDDPRPQPPKPKPVTPVVEQTPMAPVETAVNTTTPPPVASNDPAFDSDLPVIDNSDEPLPPTTLPPASS